MAQKRMFSLQVTDTDKFLDMPASAQALYFHLGMHGDDDGFVGSPKKIARATGCNDDDLRLLIAKNFIFPFESGVIVVVDWNINNTLKNDRYHATFYQDEKSKLTLDSNGRYLSVSNMEPLCAQVVSNMEPLCAQVVSNMEPELNITEPNGTKHSKKGAAAPRHTPIETNFGPELQAAFDRWLAYKQERREAYKPTGLSALVKQVEYHASLHGEKEVAQLIEDCMANGWRGIIWDRLAQPIKNRSEGSNAHGGNQESSAGKYRLDAIVL